MKAVVDVDFMPALTLHQPWASLVALGVKTIETRAWSTLYRGPLAIHAASTSKGFQSLPGDCEGNTEGGWVYGYVGDFQAAYCYRSSDEGTRGDSYLHRLEGPGATPDPGPCPLGAVVAVCQLVDVVPMIGPADPAPDGRFLYVDPDFVQLHGGPDDSAPAYDESQVPYGHFAPGRFAWLLGDVEQFEEPIPARGAQRLWRWRPPRERAAA